MVSKAWVVFLNDMPLSVWFDEDKAETEVIRLEKVPQLEDRMRFYHHREVAVEMEVTR